MVPWLIGYRVDGGPTSISGMSAMAFDNRTTRRGTNVIGGVTITEIAPRLTCSVESPLPMQVRTRIKPTCAKRVNAPRARLLSPEDPAVTCRPGQAKSGRTHLLDPNVVRGGAYAVPRSSLIPVPSRDPCCPKDGLILWWKGVQHWTDPDNGSRQMGAWLCHRCRARYITRDGVLLEVAALEQRHEGA